MDENEEIDLPPTGITASLLPAEHGDGIVIRGLAQLIPKELQRRDKEQLETISSLREKIEELQASNESKDGEVEATKEELKALKADKEKLEREVEESREEREKVSASCCPWFVVTPSVVDIVAIAI